MEVAAQPTAFALSPERTALLVVDMQHDFAAPDGMFGRVGLPIDVIQGVVEPIRLVLEKARRAGLLIVYLMMQYREDLADLGPADAPNRTIHLGMGVGDPVVAPDGSASRVLVRDTWNTRIVDELTPQPDDIVIPKHRYSGFFGTDLDTVLRARGITSLVFTGCTTSVCVESTLRDAFHRDYRCLLLTDCCAEPIASDQARTNHDATIAVVQRLFGWTTHSSQLIESIDREGATAAR
jgi:ureidoacrylate peracid hydrolase